MNEGSNLALDDLARIWVERYSANRYLASLTDAVLQERLYDILGNIFILDTLSGKYKPHIGLSSDGIYTGVRGIDWLRLAVEVNREVRLRGNPNLLDLARINKSRLRKEDELLKSSLGWSARPDLVALNPSSQVGYEQPSTLFRYAAKGRNHELLQNGTIYFTAASYFLEPGLLDAQRDAETRMEIAPFDGWWECETYWMYCMSCVYKHRLYHDFNADSCVVIRDVESFKTRIREAAYLYNADREDRAGIGEIGFSPVFYYDPFHVKPPLSGLEIRLSKHFRYAYQYEYRVAILPTASISERHVILHIGPIHDIAELVCEPATSE